MNNQMPYGFMPPSQNQPSHQGCQCIVEMRNMNERVDTLERQVRRLERRLNNLENSNNMFSRPEPVANLQSTTDNQFSNNYII